MAAPHQLHQSVCQINTHTIFRILIILSIFKSVSFIVLTNVKTNLF